MEIKFLWDGHPIDQSDMQDAESDITNELHEEFGDIISPSATICLFNDIPKAIISGIVINSNGKQVIKITRLPYQQNSTTYEPILDKKQSS